METWTVVSGQGQVLGTENGTVEEVARRLRARNLHPLQWWPSHREILVVDISELIDAVDACTSPDA